MLRQPPNGDGYLRELVALLNEAAFRKEPDILGVVYDGVNLDVRFRAAIDTPYVRVHIQSSVVGEGGVNYDPSNYMTSTVVDCRTSRVQDIEFVADPLVGYVVFLIPIQVDGAGAQVLYDGQSGRPDAVAYVSPWPVTAWLGGGIITDTGDCLATDLGQHLVQGGV